MKWHGLVPLLTAAEMQRWDRHGIDVMAIPEAVLMESAGRAAARVVNEIYPEGRVVAAIGRGNNGGDAVVMLRCLKAWGREVLAVPIGEAEIRTSLCHGWDVPVAADRDVAAAFRGAGVGVDAILGTGAKGAPRAPEAAAVRAMNTSGTPLVALDGPTGVDLSDGSVPGETVRAALTISFGAPKRGLLLFPGREHAGRVVVVETGFPPLPRDGAAAAVITPAWARERLPRLPANAHKGNAGAVAIIAGRPGMCGAAILAATGALRAGAGMVRVISAEENRVPLQTAVPEALFIPRDGDQVEMALDASDAILAGPGMGTDGSSLDLVRLLLGRPDVPILLDADALTLLARHPDVLAESLRAPLLLTPHAGEMARLLGRSIAAIVGDPFEAAADAARRFRCAVLLKGTPSLVAAPDLPVLANVTGHAGVATGGMGDTLAGIAGAFLGAGASPPEAAAIALFVAGRAAELAGRGRSLLPRDVADALPLALADFSPLGSLALPEVVLDLRPPY